MSRTILVDRLLEFVGDPFPCIGLNMAYAKKRLHKVPIQIEYDNEESVNTRRLDKDWNIGRVAFFIRELESGRRIDPIEVDSDTIYCGPVVLDGYHRLCATILAGVKTIKADFSGRMDVLDYLTGKRKYPPEDL